MFPPSGPLSDAERAQDRGWPRVTDGTSQEDRYPGALRDDYFRLDERTFADTLSMTADFAKLIRYYNLRNEWDGDWRNLFAGDEAVAMAEIFATDFGRMDTEFASVLRKSCCEAAGYIARFARRIDRWYRCLSASPGAGESLSRALIDQQMKASLNQVGEILSRERSNGNIPSVDVGLDYVYDLVWGLPFRTLADYPVTPNRGSGPETGLRTAFFAFVHALVALRPMAEHSLELSLRSGNHDPALAVFMAFAKLFAKARERANRFTGRHRDFYYRDVLRMKPRPYIPDSAFLVFEAEPGVDSLSIPAGTEFTAGKAADGTELIYCSDAKLDITDLKIRSLLTLRCDRSTAVSPERDLGFVTSMHWAEIAPVAAAGAVPSPLFVEGNPVDLGFAVAASSLLLSEGSREIVLTVQVALPHDEGDDMRGPQESPQQKRGTLFRRIILKRASNQQDDAWKSFAAGLKNNPNHLLAQNTDEMFRRVLGTAFRIDITTASGWHAVSEYTVSMPSEGSSNDPCTLSFTFKLAPEAPPVAAWNPLVHGAGYDTRFPVLRFRLDPEAVVYSYSLLQGLDVTQFSLKCTASEATNVVAWNQQGRLDTSKPFLPFGPAPGCNSWLTLGKYESARSPLTDLRFNVEWADLPEDFSTRYKGYKHVYRLEVFTASLSVLSSGRWLPLAPEKLTSPLFGTEQNFTPLLKKNFQPINPDIPEDQFLYDKKTRDGFFRVAFAAPEYGLGQSEYPSLVTEILTENALASRWFRRTPRPLPNPPYVPVINRVSVTYTATSEVVAGPGAPAEPDAAADRYYRIHPFGVETVSTARQWSMLPTYESEGNLFIGFSASRPGDELTLLFELRENASTSLADAQPVTWYYLGSHQWQRFAVLSDTTEQFLGSGIVTLQLPEDLSLNHSTMPSGLYWLCVSAPRIHASFRGIYAIRAHAVSATRRLPESGSSVPSAALPANRIQGPVNSIPGLRTVVQPQPSFGGENAETDEQMIARTSSRLRHRHRATTPSDYEHLVLENFPDVFKVKCFAAMATPGSGALELAPGAVMVVVVPYPRRTGTFEIMDPMIEATRLKRIQEFLEPLQSPFVKLEVRNPVYDQLIVSCTVELEKDAAGQLGRFAAKINQAIVDYISPWSPVGQKPRFGWKFSISEIETCIRKLDSVKAVTNLSLLRLANAGLGKGWRLDDTAGRKPAEISWQCPWSLAIPAPRHNIRIFLTGETPAPERMIAGIGKMEIGRTFVIAQ